MKVTYHATKRFLERVLHKVRYTHEDFLEAKQELEKMLLRVVPGSYSHPIPLPCYKGYVVIHRDNTVITILEKDHSFLRKKRRRG